MSIKKDFRFAGLWTAASLVASLFAFACGPAAKDKTATAAKAVADTGLATAASAGAATKPATTSISSAPAAGSRDSASPPTVLFIGTSLTAGLGLQSGQAYPALVQAKADSAGIPIRAVNAGVSGETSAGALNRIDWVMREPADIVVIETGANDALRALPVSEARANISQILDRVKAAKPHARIFLVQMEAPPNLGRPYTVAFHRMYGDLAREKGVALIPFLLNGVAGIASLNQADGLHPNIQGERIVASTVWKALMPALEG